jgi:hypothetical protein
MALSDDELKDLVQRQAAGGPQEGEIYRHYKGGRYAIVARSLMEDTLEPLVTYFSESKGTYWTRTLANFTETVDWGGKLGPRFMRIGD